MRQVKLQRSIQPYADIGLACCLLLVMLTFISAETKTWSPILEFGWLPLLLFAGWVFIGWRYQISYDDEQIVMHASGSVPTSIGFSEISQVQKEISIGRGRPFRRIVVYAQHSSGKFIDVSLKHFVLRDVRKLIQAIKNHRPDLVTPEV
jgi:hypothetical protein